MRNFMVRLALAGTFALSAFSPTAHASVIYTLNQDACTGTCGTGPFGTITLDQINATTVQVTEMLVASERFAGTGAGEALEFNIAGAVTISNLTAGFAVGPAPASASAFGSFLKSISCTACQGGQAGNPSGPLSFQITSAGGISLSSFTANTGGFYFASDIVGNNGNTGNVAANSFVSTALPPASTPEPISSLLVGAGLLAVGMFKFRRKPSDEI